MSSPFPRRAARAALAAACLSGLLASSAVAAPATVTVDNDRFSPSAVTITAGESVTWNFAESSHNVKGDGWSGNDDYGTGTFTKTFDTPSTYSYVCEAHSEMRGTVTVQPAPAQTPQPSPQPAGPAAPTASAANAAPAAWTQPVAQDLVAPRLSGVRATVKRRATRPQLALRLTEDATIVVGVRRVMTRARASAAMPLLRFQGKRGLNRFSLRLRGQRAGRYTLRIIAVDAAGNESAARRTTLRIARRRRGGEL